MAGYEYLQTLRDGNRINYWCEVCEVVGHDLAPPPPKRSRNTARAKPQKPRRRPVKKSLAPKQTSSRPSDGMQFYHLPFHVIGSFNYFVHNEGEAAADPLTSLSQPVSTVRGSFQDCEGMNFYFLNFCLDFSELQINLITIF